MMISRISPLLALVLISSGPAAFAQGDAEGGGGGGDKKFNARDFLKELKESSKTEQVTDQIGSLKDTMLETLATVRQLKDDVERLKIEVDQLKRQQQLSMLQSTVAPTAAPGAATSPGNAAPQGKIVTDEELGDAYTANRPAAAEKYNDQYVTINGVIAGFDNGSSDGDITITLKGSSHKAGGIKVNCHFLRTADFWVEIVASRDRLVNSADRTTLLVLGQPVVISGTCKGKTLDVDVSNCRVQGVAAKPKPERTRDDDRRR